MSDFLSDGDFDRFRRLIYDASGIHFSETNRSILESRLKERLRTANCEDVTRYYDHIRGNEGELRSLLDSVTTNLTRFFRNTAHVQTFEYYVIPELVKRKLTTTSRTISIWSAGCSTGEEPYTLAMILEEVLPKDFTYNIVASDLSLKSLMLGQEGFYAESRASGIPDKYLKKYFEPKDGGYRIVDSLRRNIRFDYHNLKHEPGVSNLDVIFCRNVLIYFDQAAQKSVVEKFWNALGPFAYLFIGHSESLFGMDTQFEFLRTDWACIYGKQVKQR